MTTSILRLLLVVGFGLIGSLSARQTEDGSPLEPGPIQQATPGAPAEQRPSPEGRAPSEAPLGSLSRPIIEPGLAVKLESPVTISPLRVIIVLQRQPQDVVSQQVQQTYAAEMEALTRRIEAIHGRYSSARNVEARTDADNRLDPSLLMSVEDRLELHAISEEHEALSGVIRAELARQLQREVAADQARLREVIEGEGGTFEFGLAAINAVVARVSPQAIRTIATTPGVVRIVEDRRMTGHLTNAAASTRVQDTGGLWDNGEDGGIYDPAVLDSGTDLSHPGLSDTVGRSNFYSWYLVAGGADGWFNDAFDEDDRNGHGTHVMGIVGSYGTSAYPNHLGMAHGIEKAVTLKAGWNGLDGLAYMYQSDAMYLVDRALYSPSALQPAGTFLDDVDGLNLSYGGSTPDDDTDYSRFWDSVVSSYPDLLVTLSAGNSGPNNVDFNSPANAYNPITVANVEDRNTASRTDDFIRASSTRGPTASNRRKPDIAAPGTDISSCNAFWESQLDYIDKSGTSMSSPMVQGIAMDLMDAGVLDEMRLKALLINTAQKNEGIIDFESDADGWSEAYGWGYMNAWAAYYHRGDLFTGSVTARPNSGYYRLYSGQMRDEGSIGEGRDRATLTWNRHATYNPHDYPATYYGLSDLNLRLYGEASGGLIDTDLTGDDNVHQVRVNSGTTPTDVIVKVYAWSTSFPHGGTTETFALATEENFVEVSLPGTFQGYGHWRAEVEPNEELDFEFWLYNNSDIASHSNQFDLVLPAGWSRISGSDPFSAGSIQGLGGVSPTVTWRLRAQSTPQDDVLVQSAHSHESYGEAWGPQSWSISIDVRYDTTPPTPNPMTFQITPLALGPHEIGMVATTASDLHGPVEYYFDYTFSPTGGQGGTDSGWSTARAFIDFDLEPNQQYGYRIKARDNAIAKNETGYSAVVYRYTLSNRPEMPLLKNRTATTLDVTPRGDNPAATQYAIRFRGSDGSTFYVDTFGNHNGSTPAWATLAQWGTVKVTGLQAGVRYDVRAKARNGDLLETGWSGVVPGVLDLR